MNTIGTAVQLTLFGASHDSRIGCVIDGVPAGTPVSIDRMLADLALRKPAPGIGTPRVEADMPEISGILNGVATGAPVVITFANANTKSSDYEDLRLTPRPGHADYPALCKYGEAHDIRGGGMFSGRMTTPLVAAGALLRDMIGPLGISIGSYLSRIGNVVDAGEYAAEELVRSRDNPLRAMNADLAGRMRAEILAAKAEGDSVGGIVRCMASGLPAGLGEPFFDTLDGEIAKAVFAVPGVKGISFGSGFAAAALHGSENNDPYRIVDGSVAAVTNHAGGVLGGMANGSVLDFSVAFKPTPSIARVQQTVNLRDGTSADLSVQGRHDPCIANRGAIVVEAMTAFVLADLCVRGGYLE
ncbi:chorismate synthase [Methanocorpusculum sp. MG]|uniref:Chorismate synthase n=1 Tax=Methanocorpusculum petauri TaxID=3002863 RepID=A0ABT4IDT0_9EURY|nr:chorismate synthase [Methanocorpusculum petauri]MCZ0859895.1 chorismate synthase [Methanocorpusculum petauri]MDE2443732.1 chorismate synthase [Methanocorpusculum sp.]